jgi:hypothetical protein
LCAGGSDAFEEDGCGFVVGVLGDQLAFEGFLENGLAEPGGAAKVGIEYCIGGVRNRKGSFNPGQEDSLLAAARQWDQIVAYAKMAGNTGSAEQRIVARPSLDSSREALQDLLRKIRLENCRINPGYLQALGMKVGSEARE